MSLIQSECIVTLFFYFSRWMQGWLLRSRILLCFFIIQNPFQEEPSQRHSYVTIITRNSILAQQKYIKLHLWQLFLFYEFSADSSYSLLCRLQIDCCLCSRRNRWSIFNFYWIFSILTDLQSLFLPSFKLTVLFCLQSSFYLDWSMDKFPKFNSFSWNLWRCSLQGYSPTS